MQRTALITLLTCALGFGCDSGPNDGTELQSAEIELATDDPDQRVDSEVDDQLVDAIEVHSQLLARIELASGEIEFHVDVDGPEAGSISMLEKVMPDHDGMLTPMTGDRTALQTFLEFTDDDVPVPEAMLLAEDDEQTLAAAGDRGTVDLLSEDLRPPTDRLLASAPVGWSAAFMCNEGATSAQFLDEICSMDSWWDLRFCHNGTWHSVTDYSGSSLKADWSRSRTLACQANGRARHYYKAGGIWYKNGDFSLPSGGLWYRTKEGDLKLERRITHSRTASGFVRGTSAFIRFPF